jgi:osmotically-inducible protein OsmY
MSAITDTIQTTAKSTANAASKGVASAGRTAKGIAETSFKAGRSVGGTLEQLRSRMRAAGSGSDSGGRARVAAAAGAVGAAGTFFLDPANGRRRRAMVRDRASAFVRRRAASAGRAGRYARDRASGVRAEATTERDSGRLNDAGLKAKVESEIFRDDDAPKDSVDVNVENGVVFLRGQVEDEAKIAALSTAAAAVDGVNGVESLLHLPGQEVPAAGSKEAAATA